ncbi:MAG: 50S ribosomal protein L18 [Candidatus Omnitrophica bacterium]|nr:50S ribosomal protein L18 [Candidatus Omnitrophota bacterium]
MIANLEEKIRNRHRRIRKHVTGTSERPRLCVHRSNQNLQVQVVDDYAQKTLFSLSTLESNFRSRIKCGGNIAAAKEFGRFLAESMKKKKIEKIVFDRGGFLYHGRIKALADSLREHGIQF